MRRPRLRFTIGSLMIGTAVLGVLFWVVFGLLRYGRDWFRNFPVTVVFTEGRGKDRKSRMILEKLEEPITMSFTEETPLEDVLKYIHQATTSSTYQGIPIYVDPVGLQEADKSMTSTVRNMDLEGVPLRRTLQLLLKQIDLAYFVEDGVLCVTSVKSMGRFDPTMHEPSPIMERVKNAERGELSPTEMKDLIELLKSQAEAKGWPSPRWRDPSTQTWEPTLSFREAPRERKRRRNAIRSVKRKSPKRPGPIANR